MKKKNETKCTTKSKIETSKTRSTAVERKGRSSARGKRTKAATKRYLQCVEKIREWIKEEASINFEGELPSGYIDHAHDLLKRMERIEMKKAYPFQGVDPFVGEFCLRLMIERLS